MKSPTKEENFHQSHITNTPDPSTKTTLHIDQSNVAIPVVDQSKEAIITENIDQLNEDKGKLDAEEKIKTSDEAACMENTIDMKTSPIDVNIVEDEEDVNIHEDEKDDDQILIPFPLNDIPSFFLKYYNAHWFPRHLGKSKSIFSLTQQTQQ